MVSLRLTAASDGGRGVSVIFVRNNRADDAAVRCLALSAQLRNPDTKDAALREHNSLLGGTPLAKVEQYFSNAGMPVGDPALLRFADDGANTTGVTQTAVPAGVVSTRGGYSKARSPTDAARNLLDMKSRAHNERSNDYDLGVAPPPIWGRATPKLSSAERVTLLQSLAGPVFESVESVHVAATGDSDELTDFLFSGGQIACLFGEDPGIPRHSGRVANAKTLLKLLGWTRPRKRDKRAAAAKRAEGAKRAKSGKEGT
jgi:hypothetical protein